MLSVFSIVILIFSVMLHEVAHGYMAEKLGDPTARLAGRLTLNPISHIDPFGSILLPFVLVFTGSPVVLGWAKPVPYNPNNLSRDMKYGPLKVALAGPATNMFLLVILGLIARFGAGYLNPEAVAFLGYAALVNVFLALFNLVPIPPLDGSKILPYVIPGMSLDAVERVGFMGIAIVFLFVYFFSGIIANFAAYLLAFVAGGDVLAIMASAAGL